MLLQMQRNGPAKIPSWALARRLPYLNASQQGPSDGDAKLETNFVKTTILEEGMP